MRWRLAASLMLLVTNLWPGAVAIAVHWAAWCVAKSFITLSQRAVGGAFPLQQAGRALSASNLVIFSGVFCVQWGMGNGEWGMGNGECGVGLLIDAVRAGGLGDDAAFRIAFTAYAGCSAVACLWFVGERRGGLHNLR